jgi:hypothetical protein
VNSTLPITKKDIHYSSETGEVTLKREKFDELMVFLRKTLQELENTRDEKILADFEARRASASENLAKVILNDLEAGSNAISKYLIKHSKTELAKKAGIPYATCHRILETGLASKNVRLRDYANLVRAAAHDTPTQPIEPPSEINKIFYRRRVVKHAAHDIIAQPRESHQAETLPPPNGTVRSDAHRKKQLPKAMFGR